ncbi:hypothetical protein ACFFLM_15100 [Deinococcus oregonensis]|uniref:Uncharacterized protein n=1 Tax=Deinococcus oregonensis TaxID=1805970 RepID=A0ABV6B0L5_9DEIO
MKNALPHLQLNDPPSDVAEVVALLLAFPGGTEASPNLSTDTIVEQLVPLSGEQIRRVIEAVTAQANAGNPSALLSDDPEHGMTERWREELMACRARTWPSPDQAGMLVGPHILILTDGQQGVILGAAGARVLGRSMGGSLMLLCQTIVMAEHAVNAQDLGSLRQQRIESASTTLSEIQPIE